MLNIVPIHAFTDNYIWCLVDSNTHTAAVVDPGDANPVFAFLSKENLELSEILVTHHHPDHTGGLSSLKNRFPEARVIGYAEANYSGVDDAKREGDSFTILGTTFDVIEVPGHTIDHIAFYAPAQNTLSKPALFCGDTLFSGGCGRLFEGSPQQMHDSLTKLMQLPSETLVYCTHEYTLANLKFAQTVEPGNLALLDYAKQADEVRAQDQPTLPSTLALEAKINPFLRTNSKEVRAYCGASPEVAPERVFAELRKAKDNF